MMQILQNWLDGPKNYDVGVAIYDSIGNDDVLKELFYNGETIHTKKRLEAELRAFLDAGGTNTLPVVISANDEQEMQVSDDSIMLSIRDEWQSKYQEMNLLRHKLDQYQGNAEEMIAAREPIAFAILELEQECMAIWAKRDYYQKHGRLPDVPKDEPEIPTDPVLLGKFLENLKKNIRRNRKKMTAQPGKPEYAQLYLDYKSLYYKITGNEYVEKN
jgi:hypothetical protein